MGDLVTFSRPSYPPRADEELDEFDERVIADIEGRGWHLSRVLGAGSAVGFAYTVGLFRTFHHPELLVVGLSPRAQTELLEHLVERIRAGARFGDQDTFAPPVQAEDAPSTLPPRFSFRGVAVRNYPQYFCRGCWYHGSTRFPTLQCFWSDQDGNFPWNDAFALKHLGKQPLLFQRPD